MLAIPMRIKIAYEALSGGRTVNEFPQAWDIICEADMPNLGLGFDSFHMFATNTPLDDLDMLDPAKVFLVQLADFMWTEIKSVEERIATARHFRVFPGEGVHSQALAAVSIAAEPDQAEGINPANSRIAVVVLNNRGMTTPSKYPVDEREVDISAIRAQGAGGQNVNKVSSAIHLRFDIPASSLPDDVKERLFALNDSRITEAGVLVLKAQQHRTQEMNRSDALARLQEVIDSVATPPKHRRATKPTFASKQRRLDGKSQRSSIKSGRGKGGNGDD